MADNHHPPRKEGNDEAWACMGKSKFATKGGAISAIQTMRKSRAKRRAGALEAYRCPFCHHWHIGGKL